MMKLLVGSGLNQKDLAAELDISPGEISHGFKRLKNSGLVDSENKPAREACEEFLVHGLKYIFPAELGVLSAGLPTAYSKPGFNFVKQSKDQIYVWPDPIGIVKGTSIKPIYPSLPKACRKDEKLYELSSLVEMIRVGRAREKKIAAQKAHEIIMGKTNV